MEDLIYSIQEFVDQEESYEGREIEKTSLFQQVPENQSQYREHPCSIFPVDED